MGGAVQARGEPQRHLLDASKEPTLENPICFQQRARHCMDDQIKREKTSTTENLIKAKREGGKEIEF